jgi:hypothetical protein
VLYLPFCQVYRVLLGNLLSHGHRLDPREYDSVSVRRDVDDGTATRTKVFSSTKTCCPAILTLLVKQMQCQ